jgi:two-component system, OmpR family, alkaline phosphatase synthesis response regulator PhoP
MYQAIKEDNMTVAKTGKKVLLVDDDADFVEMNKAVLENHGYEVLTAYNPQEGLARAKAGKPDLIVVDVMMTTPTDGFHLTHSLRGAEETKSVPILMVTSVNQTVPYKFEPDETWLPVDAFLEKPIQPERLLEEVGRRIGKTR